MKVTVARCATALVVVALAACAAAAHAQGTFAITLSQCGTADGFQFTINGAGAEPAQALEIDITTSELGAGPQPFFLLPTGVVDHDVSVAAVINPDGTFSFQYGAGSAQSLPATIAVYAFDTTTGTRTGSALYTTSVSQTTQCTDGSTLAGTTTGGGGGSSGSNTGGGGGGTLPTSTDQCKKDVWTAYRVFKNQGDCMSFVATHGKNGPALQP